MSIRIGAVAGWCFRGQADLEVARHCERGREHGLVHIRKRLLPDGRWERDVWFTWKESEADDG